MIFGIYGILALAVIFLSIKAAYYVDLIDKKTSLSGAFIGGVLLAAVTSLPELITSISGTVILDNPGLTLGNIMGSNIFNITILGVLILVGVKRFNKAQISTSHFNTSLAIIACYTFVAITLFAGVQNEILTVNISSILIVLAYIFGIKSLASDSGTDEELEVEDDDVDVDLTVKQILIRFVMTSIGLVFASYFVTYVTDIITVEYNLGASLAGALFLGIATSLPEVTSCIALAKLGNYNMAVGNIVGSNLFNFFIIFVADVLYTKGSVYIIGDTQTNNLLFFGLISSMILAFILKIKQNKNATYLFLVSGVAVIACYLSFLVLSV
ncbi:MAG TPA: cation transporter [Firmicutes bacterium]|nr:cation transporter [Bacillota bacterium]